MKTKLIAGLLFIATAGGIAMFPSHQQALAITTASNGTIPQQQHSIEVVFVLDTTSSMSGLIEAAKEKIWSIATTMASAQQNPDIRMGLVAFRDRGDAYVTQVLDLSKDLDSMYARLMDFRAQGGGDGPESVNQALFEAVNHISWSDNDSVYKVIFLIGDAPPHMDYANDVKYPKTLQTAKHKDIVVNAIQSGQNSATTPVWESIAQLGSGNFFQVENSGNTVAISTPFDKKLSELAARLEDTRLYFGNQQEQKSQKRKIDANNKLRDELSSAALARRATYNSTASGKANFLGDGELVDAITSGEITLEEIEADDMPATLRSMAPAEQMIVIKNQAAKRDQIRQEIKSISESRSNFIHQKIEAEGGAKDSLDEKIYNAVKQQAGALGLVYDKDNASY